MDAVLTDMTRAPDGIRVQLDGRRAELSWRWLRDHATDGSSFDARSHQRLVTPAEVRAAGPASVRLDDTGDALLVEWPDGPATTFTASELRGIVGDSGSSGHAISRLDPRPGATAGRDTTAERRAGSPTDMPPPLPWRGTDLAERLARPAYDELVSTDDGRRAAVTAFFRDGVVVVRDVPVDLAATRRVLERFGYVRTTIFGDVWEYGSDGALDDTASTTLEISPHTDGTYSNDAPGLLGLHCVLFDATGGESVLVDGQAVVSRLRAEAPEHVEVLRTVDVPGRYIGDGAHLLARRPPLRVDGDRLVQISYNHHDRAPMLLAEPAMSQLYDALFALHALAEDRQLQFEVALRPGDMLLLDNWRVLHGRRAFAGTRRIAGGYVNREDVESTMRLLAAADRQIQLAEVPRCDGSPSA